MSYENYNQFQKTIKTIKNKLEGKIEYLRSKFSQYVY